MAINFAQAAFSMAPGQVDGPVREDNDLYNCYLVRLRDIRDPSTKQFDEEKSELARTTAAVLGMERRMLSQAEALNRELTRK
jgi:parvulin-like peptidyl-prolyl isomerase